MSSSRLPASPVGYKRTDAPEANGSVQRGITVRVRANLPVAVCPCLGTVEDADTALAFTSPGNRCYRAGRPMVVSLSHQQTHCLATGHTSCPIFRSQAQRPPGRRPTLSANGRQRRLIVRAARRLLFLVVGASLLLTAFLWLRPTWANVATPAMDRMEEKSNRLFLPVVQSPLLPAQPTAVLTDSPNPTPAASPKTVVADTAVPPAAGEPAGPPATTTATPEAELAASITPSSHSCSLPVGWTVYAVQRGDTLYALARRRGTSVTAVKEANCLPNNLIITGQRIFLPDAPIPVSPEPEPTGTPLPEYIQVNTAAK